MEYEKAIARAVLGKDTCDQIEKDILAADGKAVENSMMGKQQSDEKPYVLGHGFYSENDLKGDVFQNKIMMSEDGFYLKGIKLNNGDEASISYVEATTGMPYVTTKSGAEFLGGSVVASSDYGNMLDALAEKKPQKEFRLPDYKNMHGRISLFDLDIEDFPQARMLINNLSLAVSDWSEEGARYSFNFDIMENDGSVFAFLNDSIVGQKEHSAVLRTYSREGTELTKLHVKFTIGHFNTSYDWSDSGLVKYVVVPNIIRAHRG